MEGGAIVDFPRWFVECSRRSDSCRYGASCIESGEHRERVEPTWGGFAAARERAEILPWQSYARSPVLVRCSPRSRRCSGNHAAKDIDASRLKFHGIPSFDPRPYLDNRNRAHYERPQDAVFPVDPQTLPNVKLRASPPARMQFLEKLDSGQRLQLVPWRNVEKGFENGAFAIPKDQEKDRLVLDARRPNAREHSEKRWVFTMGAASQLNFVYLEDQDIMLIHAEDLKDFYHAFVVGESRVLRNCFKMKVRPREVEHLQCYRPEMASEDWLDSSTLHYGHGRHKCRSFWSWGRSNLD